MLPLPQGGTELKRLPIFNLKTNTFATARVEGGPGFVRFEAAYDPRTALDAPPL